MAVTNMLCLSLALFFVSLLVTSSNGTPDKMVCYIGSWSVYRNGDGAFVIDKIPPSLCTHLIYSFITITNDGNVKIMDPYSDLTEDYGKGGFKKLNDLKRYSPTLKTLVAMGGWNEGSERYSRLFSSASFRKTFAVNAANFLKKYGFDGLDLDWEYPAQRGGSHADIANFVELCKALRTEFDRHGFLLTAAVAAAEFSVVQSYDVPNLVKYLDFINVMTYDFHGGWESQTGHNAPLYMSNVEVNTPSAGLNMDAGIQTWIRLGAPPSKLVMGFGFYGHTFTIPSGTSCTTARCPATGVGKAGALTGEAGFLGYHEICRIEKFDNKAKMFWDDESKTPYLITGNQWISYDNEKSIKIKIDYIKKYNLGGAMVWSIDTDDFKGKCGMGSYPLLNALSSGIKSLSEGSPNPPPPQITTSAPVVTEGPAAPHEPEFTNAPVDPTESTYAPPAIDESTDAPTEICTEEGYIRDPTDCQAFYYCKKLHDGFQMVPFACSGDLVFDQNIHVCNYRRHVKC